MRKFLLHRGTKGFTIIELMVSLMVLSLISLFSANIYLNFTSSSRDIKAGNLVHEEARFLMERIVREVRQNTIDYEQYFNQNVVIPYNLSLGITGSYGDNYCAYSAFFYDDNGESIGARNLTQDPLYAATAPSGNASAITPIENELYLINISGNKRTILTRIEKQDGDETIGKVAMLRMVGKDFGDDGINGRDPYNDGTNGAFCTTDERENDGLIDSWHCDPDYPCKTEEDISGADGCQGHTHLAVNDPSDTNHSFVDISPNTLNIVDLKFMIAPEDDPWKAYNMNNVQIQPHITIQLTAEANPKLIDTSAEAHLPSITLTSTITTRNYNEIKSDCRK